VITRLGKITDLSTDLVENLFTADLAYLQDFYREINSDAGSGSISVTCPECQHVFEVETPGSGDRRLPLESLYEEVAFVAFHFHWPLEDILNLEHGDRQRFMDEISAINRQMNASSGPAPSQGIPSRFGPD